MDFTRLTWTPTDYAAYRNELLSLADEGYREFAARGVPTDRPLLGVRLPVLRDLAKEIAKGNHAAFLSHEPASIEEVLVRGFVIGRLPYDEMLTNLPSHLPYLDNWETVDCYASSLKSIKSHLSDFYDQILEPLLTDSAPQTVATDSALATPPTSPALERTTPDPASPEFTTRLALVLLLDYYITPDYLHLIYDHATRLADRDEYYVRMALAWLLAETFIKFPDETVAFLKAHTLPRWTHNKAISKICDSYRVPTEVKDDLKPLRR